MGLDYRELLADLQLESDRLIQALVDLTNGQWVLPTPAEGWSIHDQVSHLAFFDDAARTALTEPEQFRAMADELTAEGMDFPDRVAAKYRSLASQALLDWFRVARRDLLIAFNHEDPRRRVPWFGPEMSVASSATARLMETWAHGNDVYDALGVEHPTSPALRSIAHLGVATFGFAYVNNGLEVPDEPVHVDLAGPEGELWSWGPPNAVNRVSGPARDFVLVVTQRRHWRETALQVEGSIASEWLEIAQAFAGAPTRRAM